MHTTIFFQASLPQVLLVFRLHICSMFLNTPIIVRANRNSSSLYMVTTMNNSVCLGFANKRCLRANRSPKNSDGSQVAAEYLICVNSSLSGGFAWGTLARSLGGTGQSSTKLPLNS